MTLDDTPATVTSDPPEPEPEPEFDEAAARHAAPLILAKGRTAQDVRLYAAGEPDYADMFLMIADAMDAMLAEGFDPAAYAESLRSGDGAR